MEKTPLTGATLKDRLHILTILANRAGHKIRWTLASPGRAAAKLRAKTPDSLLIAPQDIRTSDPTTAADIAAGYFAFGGKIVNARGRSPFTIEPGSEAWARQLAGFGWLRHLRSADGPAARARGRRLVEDFLDVHERPAPGVAWEPDVAARRLLAWLSQSPVILAGAERTFYTRFMRALATHRADLDQRISALRGDERLLAALALAAFGLCARDADALQRSGTAALAAAIDAQVLPDGGHVSRNPQTLIDLLLDLLPLRQAYAARGVQAPQQLLNAIDRMMPMLRLFRHGDGTLALFNGMSVTAPELVATILAYDDARARPLANAPYSGYQRIEAEATILLVEAGAVPPQPFSTRAGAGCLSFELSSGIRRIVINCGAPDVSRASARHAARTTAAHSTLVIDNTSSCRFAANAGLERWLGDQILKGPVTVPVERTEAETGTRIVMSHDGYATRFGRIHHRALTLARDGSRLDGHDRLEPTGKREPQAFPYALRFHLHPGVKARRSGDGSIVRLDATDGESWVMEADLPMVIEPSVLFAATGGARATSQITIHVDGGGRREIRWSFQRLTPGRGRQP